MNHYTLTEIPLSDLDWVDEFQYSRARLDVRMAVTGSLQQQKSQALSGRPMTLQGGEDCAWLDRATIEALVALADDISQGPHTLIHPDGREFLVEFDHSQGPSVQATPVNGYRLPQLPTDPYAPLIKLLIVG